MPSTKSASPKTSPAPKPKKSAAKKSPPTREQIAMRAYQIYLDRNGAPGNPFEDWTQAERELMANAAPKSRRKASPKSQAA